MEYHESTRQQDMTEPLIRQDEKGSIISEEDDDLKPENPSQKGSPGVEWLSTAIAVWGSFQFGCCLNLQVHYTSPTQTAIRKDLNLSLAEYSVFASVLAIGAMIGGLTSGHISDLIGRKGTMRVAAAFCIVGWLAIGFTEGVLLLDLGRMCTGYGIGIFSYVVPVFIAEIAPKDLRGGFTSLNELMIQVGGSITYLLGTVLTWRMLALVGLIPSLMLILGMFFVPESPRWLEYTEKLQQMPQIRILDLFQKRYLHSVIIGVGLMLFKQFGGMSAIGSYASATLELAGFSSGKFGTIVIGLCQIPVTTIAVALMDRCGRRPLLLVSSVGTFLGTFLIGLAFYLKDHELVLKLIPMMVLAGVLIYLWSLASGIGSASWVIMSEIFPLNVKGAAGSLAIWANWFGSWAVSYTFNYLISWSSSGTFFLYSAVSAAAILFVAKLVPETRRRTLEEIQAHMLFSNSHS
ncbi:sugar transporter ERD6-like 16 isoform X3 [Vitis vinifera]|uniref:sugar transporter ERD6-like 16 isoform X3 n=1 Tax=Vitis vinifera TaxID=29760 RepID=UPI0008FF8F25|nr:sugar transporter ERD6-like 16 isoform X3 [Vitis vinifera]|eukprot:XP_019075604.1 PREDICTED: sugar transporter ERD6-like 16 isoform X5 [Vitis vinifera]